MKLNTLMVQQWNDVQYVVRSGIDDTVKTGTVKYVQYGTQYKVDL